MFTGTMKYLNKNAKCQVLTVQSKDTNYLTKWKSKIHHGCLQETQLIDKDSTDQTSEEIFYILPKWKQEAGRSGHSYSEQSTLRRQSRKIESLHISKGNILHHEYYDDYKYTGIKFLAHQNLIKQALLDMGKWIGLDNGHFDRQFL